MKLKGKLYNMVSIRNMSRKMNIAEMRVLRWMSNNKLRDGIRNKLIIKVGGFSDWG